MSVSQDKDLRISPMLDECPVCEFGGGLRRSSGVIEAIGEVVSQLSSAGFTFPARKCPADVIAFLGAVLVG